MTFISINLISVCDFVCVIYHITFCVPEIKKLGTLPCLKILLSVIGQNKSMMAAVYFALIGLSTHGLCSLLEMYGFANFSF